MGGGGNGGAATDHVAVQGEGYGGLRPGVNVNAESGVGQAADAIAVAKAAVERSDVVLVTTESPSAANADPAMTAPEGYVYVKVETGISDNDYIEVTGGLTEEDTVAYDASSAPMDFSYAPGGPGGPAVTVTGGPV